MGIRGWTVKLMSDKFSEGFVCVILRVGLVDLETFQRFRILLHTVFDSPVGEFVNEGNYVPISINGRDFQMS